MPAFVFLVVIGCIALWFLLSWLYKPVGRFFYRIYKDAVDELTDNKENKE